MSKPAPTFWWDFVDNATAVIVESDYPGGQELARFEVIEGAVLGRKFARPNN